MPSATMVANPPGPRDRKTTLLVLPSSVVDQWNDEIVKHVNEGVFPKIMTWKSTFGISLSNLQDQDVVREYCQRRSLNVPVFTPLNLHRPSHHVWGGHEKL
jgi:hypothetical protein